MFYNVKINLKYIIQSIFINLLLDYYILLRGWLQLNICLPKNNRHICDYLFKYVWFYSDIIFF